MISKYDEFLCHQTVSTFDSVGTSAREWTERVWFSIHDTTGKCHFVSGFGVYPNRNVMDAYATFAVDGKVQHNVRASRMLHPNTDEMKVGPLSYEIIEPLKKLHLKLEENEHGLSFDLIWDASMEPHEEETQYSKSDGREIENIKRYVQVGRPSGWIKADGETYQVDGDNWRGERDHSWGVRQGGGVSEIGVQPKDYPDGYVYAFGLGQFDDWGISFHAREDKDGVPSHFCGGVHYPMGTGKASLEMTKVDHNFTFRDDMRQINGGEFTIHLEDGSEKTITVKPLSVNYIVAGGYFGYKDFVHGEWKGEYFEDSVKIDMTDPAAIKEVSFLDDMMCEFRCGDEVGYGIIEVVAVGTVKKYGFEGF